MGKNLVIYATFGEGHKRAAWSLKKFLNAPCRDLLEFCPPFIKKIYSTTYTIITDKFTFIWQILFNSSKNKFVNHVLGIIHRYIFSSLFKYLEQEKFEAVIVTHFFPLQLISSVKQKLGLKIITIITDLRVHPLWINDNVDFYFAAVKETKEDLVKLGIDEKKIVVGAVPVREGFLKTPLDDDVRNKFSIDNRPVLFFVSSLRGNFPYLKDLISHLQDDFNSFVIYGKNEKLKEDLQRLTSPSLRILPFYEEIWELFGVSSIIISKPGGLTVFEGIYMKKPFIFTHYIPGQEEENMKLLSKYGIAKYADNEDELLDAIHYFQARFDEIKNNYPIEVKDIRPVLEAVLAA
jgi:processive 1,2-diacylglycerol beta-glucosyltransferase